MRLDNSPAHMHNKFVVIDGQVCITGSFNWTVQAVTANRENVLVTNNRECVQSFAGEFANLWTLFAKNTI